MVRQGLAGWSGKPMSWPAFRNLILSPFYVGLAKYDGELYRGPQGPLVDLETWKAARRNLLAREEYSREEASRRHQGRNKLIFAHYGHHAN